MTLQELFDRVQKGEVNFMIKKMCRIENVYKVIGWEDYDGKGYPFLEVGPDSEFSTLLELRTTDEKSKQFYGDIRIVLTKEMAKALGETLIKAANEMEK
jgi:hypothetical protein